MNENAHRTPSRARPQPVLPRAAVAIALCLLATSCGLYDRTVFGGRPGTVEYPGSAAPPDAPAIYVVRQGDTVEGIAGRFGVPPSTIAERNSLKPSDKLAEGQWLEIPNARVIEQAAAPGAPSSPSGPPSSTGGQVASADLPPPPGATPSRPPSPVAGTLPPAASRPDTRTASAPPESGSAPRPVPIPMPAGSPTAAAPPAASPPAASPPPAAAPPTSTAARFDWPVRGATLQAFGSRPDGQRNDGINIAAAKGTTVKAAAGGTVAYVGNEVRGLGNLVLLSHADGYVTAYAHLDKTSVDKGATVRKGQTIGTVGQTGSVSQPQLHFEIRLRNKPVDPATLLP